ncbi:MAG: response regulator [Geobacteraceae bacterium]|nr:response regulator [Geobacteraceae bacterium]
MKLKRIDSARAANIKRILVVEDEDNTRHALTKLLTREGYFVEGVANGYEALCYLRRQSVNLIVTDIKMPRMDGITFLRELNKNFPKSNVIMITAYGGVDSYLEAMNLGAFEYINKPVQIDELKIIMEKILAADDTETSTKGGT